MKSLCKYCVGIFIIFAMIGGSVASAIPVTQESQTTTLTVVFGAPSEFDLLAGTGIPGSAGRTVTSAEAVVANVAGGPGNAPNTPAVAVVPEPSTLILLGLGVLGLLGLARRRKH